MLIAALSACLLLNVVQCAVAPGGILFPRESETREVVSLDGLWNFALAPTTDPSMGHREAWYQKGLTKVKQYKKNFGNVHPMLNQLMFCFVA